MPETSSQNLRKRSFGEHQIQDEQSSRDVTPELDEHYVTLRTEVVGVQYYAGMVGRGEYVMLRRQPQNQYDSNAVQVQNASGIQVGHIPRMVAARLGPLMDAQQITVEGRMVSQNLDGAKHYKLGMDMSIYARGSLRDILEPKLDWATPNGEGFDAMRRQAMAVASTQNDKRTKGKGRAVGGNAQTGVTGAGPSSVAITKDQEILRLLDGLKKVGEDEQHADSVMDSLTADIDVARLPLHASPPGVGKKLEVDLLPHQSQALRWMIDRENPTLPKTASDAPVQFWTRQSSSRPGTKDYWLNVATRQPQTDLPDLGSGGILADGMGLGKTLTVLSLVLATKTKTPGPTLIVCPLSVLSNWEKQIHEHVESGGLSVHTYHGEGREVTATTLGQYDIVLTTYQTVTGDTDETKLAKTTPTPSKAKKAKISPGALFRVHWNRLVADEGHVLRNPRAKMTQAFRSLKADKRWICTGTPIVNSPSDLGSLLSCLSVCKPLDQPDYFKSLLLRPLNNGDPGAAKLLQALVAQILLRRTKDSKDKDGHRLVDLPPIEYFQVPVKLDEQTRALYEEVFAHSANRFEQAVRTGEGTASVLSLLTRMRQLCLSAELVPASFFDELRTPRTLSKATSIVSLPPERREELIDKLRRMLADEEECAICYSAPMSSPRVTDCGHAFCNDCISEVIFRDMPCPMDRHPIRLDSLLELPDTEGFVSPDDSASPITSAKIEELIKYLEAFDIDDKTLVFSQFTTFLDHVGAALRERDIAYLRFDGSMSAQKRRETIAAFQRADNSPRVMLISLKSGAVGLNLTAASNVVLCDPWWQSAIEAQAIDRVHRMGQKKPVRVFQLIAEDTIESKVLEIQKRKDDLVAQTFAKSGKESAQAKRKARFEELRMLFRK